MARAATRAFWFLRLRILDRKDRAAEINRWLDSGLCAPAFASRSMDGVK